MSDDFAIWTGFLRPDGRKGIRNITLVIYTVECAKFVAHEIAREETDTHVIGFPGCYDNAYAIRLLLALARHPNVGAVLSVGLGCEYTQPGRIAAVVEESGRPAAHFFIQEAGGTRSSIDKGKALLKELESESDKRAQRVPMTLGDLTIGCECGGSDATSGLAGNPVVGRMFDRLVDAGGSAVSKRPSSRLDSKMFFWTERQAKTRGNKSHTRTTKPRPIADRSGSTRHRQGTSWAD